VTSLRTIIFLAFSIILCSSVLAADASVERTYALSGHGALILHLPAGWDDQVRQHPGNFPPTIVLTGFEGTPFVVMITPRWAGPGAEPDFGTPKSIHALVEKAAQAAEPESVGDRISIVTLGGGNGPGYYFSATDRDPKPGDFKYMTQGAVRVGELVCTFTILTNDDKSVAKNKTLSMLSKSIQRPGK
jgi:hypothetical protein